MAYHINNTEHFRKALGNGAYAWPGGYDVAFITSDGAVLCHECAKNNEREISEAIEYRTSNGWRVFAVESTDSWDTGETCAHCTKHLGPEPEPVPERSERERFYSDEGRDSADDEPYYPEW